METLLSAPQVLTALRRLEPRRRLTYQQLRDLERRGCVAPRVMPGGRAPRAYGFADVLLLRAAVRMQADPLLRRWQVWSVLAHLRDAVVEAASEGRACTLLVQGARGRLVRPRDAADVRGVDVPLTDLARGVREAMREARGDVWTGAAWCAARDVHAYARPWSELNA